MFHNLTPPFVALLIVVLIVLIAAWRSRAQILHQLKIPNRIMNQAEDIVEDKKRKTDIDRQGETRRSNKR